MNGDMRFGQQHHAGNALAGPEGMEVAIDDSGAGGRGSLPQEGIDGTGIAQLAARNAMQVGNQVRAGMAQRRGGHLCPPPPQEPPPELELQLLPER